MKNGKRRSPLIKKADPGIGDSFTEGLYGRTRSTIKSG